MLLTQHDHSILLTCIRLGAMIHEERAKKFQALGQRTEAIMAASFAQECVRLETILTKRP